MTSCPLCGIDVNIGRVRERDSYYVNCSPCGNYYITREAIDDMKGEIGHKKYLLQGLTREASEEGTPLFISSRELKNLVSEAVNKKPSPLDAIDIVLRYISKKIAGPLDQANVNPAVDYPLIFTNNRDELQWVLNKLHELGYIESPITQRLTVNGWKRLTEIGSQPKRYNQAFIAMWFHESTNEAYEQGIKPALESLGYNPVRIDLVEHNEKICDRIIAEIRKSSLLIADFTGHRGGAYFEAGFAMGLGIPVIWTCRENDIENSHFDTRQYNHIVWSNPNELRDKIVNRIQATIPQRPGR